MDADFYLTKLFLSKREYQIILSAKDGCLKHLQLTLTSLISKNASEMRFNTTTLSLLGFQLEAHWPEWLCGIVMESACDRGCYEAFSLI